MLRVPFKRFGGFHPFPLAPSVYRIADFTVKWKTWIVFDFFEVRESGRAVFKTNIDSKILSDGKPDGYVLDRNMPRHEGIRFEAHWKSMNYRAICTQFKSGGTNGAAVFKCYRNESEIGHFEWKPEFQEGIEGYYYESMRRDTWFIGMSLMKIWVSENDVLIVPA